MLFLPREDGQGLVEYALILVLVAIAVIALLTLLGGTVGDVFSNITSALGV
jgi:pilus assembly protein Flp/PilA